MGSMAKKLEKFKDENAPPARRLKSLQSFVEHATQEEMQALFGENSSFVYSLVLRCFELWCLAAGQQVGKGKTAKSKASLPDLFNILSYLKMIFQFQPERIQARWQSRSLGALMESLLVTENKHAIRMYGFDLLLMYLSDMGEALDESRDKKFVTFFRSMIDFEPFVSAYSGARDIVLKHPPIAGPKPCCAAVPAPTPLQQQKDSVELFEKLLEFITNDKPTLFQFWFNLLKGSIISTLYPAVCKRIQTLDESDPTGFTQFCPREMQKVLVSWIVKWIGKPEHFAVVCGSESNLSLILELFRQSLELPLNYSETSEASIDMYHMWVKGDNRPPILKDNLQFYLQEFIRHLARRFAAVGDRTPTADMLQKQVTLCKKILTIFVEIAVRNAEECTEDTWVLLLETVTNICHDLFINKPFTPAASLAQELADAAPDTLFSIWIRSRTTNMDLWTDLNTKMKQWGEWKSVVQQWRRAIVQLSCMYCVKIYETTAAIRLFDISAPKIDEVLAAEARCNAGGGGAPGDAGAPMTDADAHQAMKRRKDPSTAFLSAVDLARVDKWEVELGKLVARGLPISEGMQWDQDTLEFIWQRFFRLWGNICDIENVDNNAHALETLELLCDVFLKFDGTANRRVETNLVPHMLILFAPTLFDACSLAPQYNRSIVTAYGAMCRLMCRRFDEPDEEVLDRYLSHFYAFLHEGLTGEDKGVLCAILEHSSNLFGLCFKGVNILIPDYLRAIRRVMNISFQPAPPEHVRKAAIELLVSLICFPNHHPDVALPDLKYTVMMDGAEADEDESRRRSLPFIELKNSIASLLFAIVKDEYLTTTKCMCLWGLCVQIMEELYHTPKEVVVVKCVKMIQSHCVNSDGLVARTAVDVFVSLASCYELLEQVDSTIITMIVEGLCADVIDQIQQLRQMSSGAKKRPAEEAEEIIVAMYQCLAEWILCNPVQLLGDSSVSKKVFEAIEFGLFGEKDDGTKKMLMQNAPAPPQAEEKKRQTVADLQKRQTQALGSGHGALAAAAAATGTGPASGGLSAVSEAAEILGIQLLNVVNNFPSPLGAARTDSSVLEVDDGLLSEDTGVPGDEAIVSALNLRYFVLNGRTVLSFAELPRPDGMGTFCRLIVRDMTGKYCLDTSMEYFPFDGDEPGLPGLEPEAEEEEPVQPSVDVSSNPSGTDTGPPTPVTPGAGPHFGDTEAGEGAPAPAPDKPEAAGEGESAVKPEGEEAAEEEFPLVTVKMITDQTPEAGDLLETLVNIVRGTYGELQPSPCHPSIHAVAPVLPMSLGDELEAVSSLFRFQAQAEVEQLDAKVPELFPALPVDPVMPASPFHACRVFLSQVGLLSPLEPTLFQPLENSGKLQRSLKSLDKTPGRELLKIGVVYVAAGQDNQRIILRNMAPNTSQQYENFVSSLGWKVDLSSHRGFLGGLDRNLTNGTHSIYWASPNYEVMFHVATMMPTSATDAQQIMKKRHIGNDIVHVVWSEHYRDYRPTTITSQFNDAHLVVYPLPNGLFRVQVFYKNKVPLFGPLLSGMIIGRDLLPVLTRLTAVNANRIVRYSTVGYKRPYLTRRDLLCELVGRYSVDCSFSKYLSNLFGALQAGQPAT